MNRCALQLLTTVLLAWPVAALPSLDEALAAKEDLWGLAALRETNGPSYEFFAGLLPPLRYVNAKFHYYPIVLSAQAGLHKGRLVSDGSAINASPGLRTWKETGVPVAFFVGEQQVAFSASAPHYEEGYLPIVQLDFQADGNTYREETFADAGRGGHGILLTRFELKEGTSGTIRARVDSTNLVAFDQSWRWDHSEKVLTAKISPHHPATLAIASVPGGTLTAAHYDARKRKCIDAWKQILDRVMRVETAEATVNAAWKSTLIGSLMLRQGDNMNYSAGNAYEVMYEAESGDAVRALLMWGLTNEARAMIPPLLDYGIAPGLKFHDAGFKLQLLAHYYWLTRDAEFIRAQKSRWSKCIDVLTRERDAATGLLPAENYCGDEFENVFSLNSDANAWRGLRDMATVLQQIGENTSAGETAEALRAATFAAVNKSERRDITPPFIPVALFGQEKPYDVITATRRGSYYDLMLPYVIGSGIFGHNSERETAMLGYLQEHGGLCMGMIRFDQHSGLFANETGLDDLYGLRYTDALLRRDEPEQALVSFYGKLAQGMTRDTFLSAEGTGLRALDDNGRPMYLPPSCSGNAFFLTMLRNLLVQDDVNDAGEPKTLRLLFATPRRWLEDGQQIRVEHALTAFGEVSVRVRSRLKQHTVLAEIQMPSRSLPEKTLLRIRLPDGRKILSAQCGSRVLTAAEDGTVDISRMRGRVSLRFITD